LGRRQRKGPTEFRNADRAHLGSSAIVHFARVAGQTHDLREDPETVLTDLLTDLMHWCDDHGARRYPQVARFAEALRMAQRHFSEESRPADTLDPSDKC
jgi:hypothetical protein